MALGFPKLKDGKCLTEVQTPGLRGFYYHQCTKPLWKDGKCKMHHPDTIKAKQEAREIAYQAKQANSPWVRLAAANERIKKLEVEVARLKKKLSNK